MLEIVRRLRSAVRSVVRPSVVIGSPDHRCSMLHLGSEYGGWTIHPDTIRPDSVVYSFGVGEDITWDVAMIDRFGVKVEAFDPTPKSVEHIRSRQPSEHFHFHEYGLADKDGELKFYAPENPAHVSHSVHERPTPVPTLILPVRRLRTIMSSLGHDHIDVLKMDIEGSEYAVIEDILEEGIPIRQLLVEYHHRFPTVGKAKTEESLALLRRHGYRLFFISDNGEEYSFIRVDEKG